MPTFLMLVTVGAFLWAGYELYRDIRDRIAEDANEDTTDYHNGQEGER